MDSTVTVSQEDGRTVVSLAGEHDIATQAQLAAALAKAIAADDLDLIVDLSGVTFMSVATVDELLRGRLFLQDHSRELTLREPSSIAARVLGLCGLNAVEAPRVLTG